MIENVLAYPETGKSTKIMLLPNIFQLPTFGTESIVQII